MYPGGTSDTHWPRLGLNTLKWAKKQGAVCGPAHSGNGLAVASTELPNLLRFPRLTVSARMSISWTITHEVPGPDWQASVPAVDFNSTADTPYNWELNIWYHTLNCGFRQRISGETDFPCITGDRVGGGRSYVKVDGKLTYDKWCDGIQQGRCYVGDGRSHLMDFRAENVAVGENGSELRLSAPRTVKLTAKVAALLGDQPDTRIKNAPLYQNPRLAHRAGAHRRDTRSAGRGHRKRLPGGETELPRRRDDARHHLRRKDRALAVGSRSYPRLVAHQSDLCSGRRQTHPCQ
jgi:hypothetical protein